MIRSLVLLLCAAALALPASAAPRTDVRSWRQAHERAVLEEFETLLAVPNVATRVADIELNADLIVRMLEKRGLKARKLYAAPGTPPAIYAELKTPGARRTVAYYAHYDGQPVTPSQWTSPPFTPTLRAGAETVDWRKAAAIDPEWRLFARGASDDKVSVMAMLAAIDALKAAGRKPSVNIKLFFDGEEEMGSPHLKAILEQNRALLKADLWLIGDGPVHQSRRMQVVFGARGVTDLEATVYGPARALHSGHYGNWAPNPAVMAAELVGQLRDSEGRILIPGFADTVRPLTPAEQAALDALPPVEDQLRAELRIGRTEGSQRLGDSLMRPALNVRGIRAGAVGEEAANAIPTEARVSIDFRLVPGQTPAQVREKTEAWLAAKGWTIVHGPQAERPQGSRVVRLDWGDGGYPAYRSDLGSTEARAVVAAVNAGRGEPAILMPMLGGSVPLALFDEVFGAPVIVIPIANHDNNQHAANENIRLQNLWDGIETYAGLFSALKW
jgi:acetylornithine deacetylase/succinyl-diaminopimelate desuccinylase-like protein